MAEYPHTNKPLEGWGLMSIRKTTKRDFSEVLDKLRSKSEVVPDLDEITREVEAVRSKRYNR